MRSEIGDLGSEIGDLEIQRLEIGVEVGDSEIGNLDIGYRRWMLSPILKLRMCIESQMLRNAEIQNAAFATDCARSLLHVNAREHREGNCVMRGVAAAAT